MVDARERTPERRTPGRLLTVERHDRYRWLTSLALLGVVAAAAMALVGLPPVDTHGPLHWLGIMGPTCGATRAAMFTARGELGLAWTYNPLGIAAVVGAGLMTARALWGISTRRWPAWALSLSPRARRVLWLVALATLVMLEVRQQGRANLLMGP